MPNFKGCWKLLDSLGNETSLYTRKAFQFAEDSKNKAEYRRGVYLLFPLDTFPKLIEDDLGRYNFYYPDKDHPGKFVLEDYAKEIYVDRMFHK